MKHLFYGVDAISSEKRFTCIDDCYQNLYEKNGQRGIDAFDVEALMM